MYTVYQLTIVGGGAYPSSHWARGGVHPWTALGELGLKPRNPENLIGCHLKICEVVKDRSTSHMTCLCHHLILSSCPLTSSKKYGFPWSLLFIEAKPIARCSPSNAVTHKPLGCHSPLGNLPHKYNSDHILISHLLPCNSVPRKCWIYCCCVSDKKLMRVIKQL